jgi:hypothetical protein
MTWILRRAVELDSALGHSRPLGSVAVCEMSPGGPAREGLIRLSRDARRWCCGSCPRSAENTIAGELLLLAREVHSKS